MKLDALHWIQLILMAIAGGASAVSSSGDAQLSHVMTPIAAAAVGMLGALGLVGRSVFANVNNGAAMYVPQPPTAPGIVVKP
jgi:hypothetical protein